MNILLRGVAILAILFEAACSGRHQDYPVDAGSAEGRRDITLADCDQDDETNPYDPAEAVNRRTFEINMAVDHKITKPVARTYMQKVPYDVRHAVHNFVTNLGEPKVLVNDLLQGNFSRAPNSTARFILNSTAGVAGLFDVARRLNLPHHEADFGQTFGVWGVPPGPALQIPILGSSNLRDTAGLAFGFVADPLARIPGGAMTGISVAGAGGGAVDGRAEVLDVTNALERTSLDYYATLRSVRAQRRAALVEDGRAGLIDSHVDASPGTAD